ncbi:MAG: putative toxin-antitoxin system toxin component, PIN family [Thermomicrobiales bacterium]|nr:putative toxin-antitoxin system toxin component, PIN family [Thermomicrobiales bacterium]
MKLVLDTVVLVRALIHPAGRPGQLVHQCEWVVSPEIAAEYVDVMSRPRLARKFSAGPWRSRAIVENIIGRATSVTPKSIPAICRDPSDDKFLAAALTANADYIVSEDLDLLSLGSYEGIPSCDTRAMIDILTANEPS